MNSICINSGQLYKRSEVITVAAGATVSNSFTITKGRGDVKALNLVCSAAGGALHDLSQCTVDINDNGQSIIESDVLTGWSADYNDSQDNAINVTLKAGGEINYSFVNSSASQIIVVIEQFFTNL